MNNATTGAVTFANHQLFRVNPGISSEHALNQASMLMACVNKLTLMGETEEDATLVWAAHFLGEMAKAIIDDVNLGGDCAYAGHQAV
ncbi:DUF3077 domain-containing protein [Pseudomonas putida]|uniref:DUF3077 domain-containing protein n=1 Tax=Pseudomonas putida TaxID=303 RepID=UPI00236502AD|nr:DUF3077 domain-containing protein [Pseudomonas putida]MDD2048929.1 DUF3077 domain-containing protein [Pseudomonas putida]